MPAGYTSVAGDMTGLAAIAYESGDGRTCHDRGKPRVALLQFSKTASGRARSASRAVPFRA